MANLHLDDYLELDFMKNPETLVQDISPALQSAILTYAELT